MRKRPVSPITFPSRSVIVYQTESSDLWATVMRFLSSSSSVGFSKPHWNITSGLLNQ